jgi:hypothetical protein
LISKLNRPSNIELTSCAIAIGATDEGEPTMRDWQKPESRRLLRIRRHTHRSRLIWHGAVVTRMT